MASIAARLDRLPPSRFIRGLVLRISVGGWFELYDLFMTAYISLGMIKDGLFSAGTFAGFVASGFAGMFIGTLGFSWISDRFGRKIAFTLALLWYSTANLGMAFAPSAAAIDVWRFIAGIGIGVQLVTIDTYISELTPKLERGRAIALSQFIGYFAIPTAALLAYFLVPHAYWGISGWRFVAAAGSLGAIAIWFVRAGLPESPRWLDAHGDPQRAEAVTAMIESAVAAETKLPLPPAHEAPVPAHSRLRAMWAPPLRRRTALMIGFNLLQPIGFYGFASWVPILLAKEGVSIVHSLLYTAIIAVINPLGPLVALRYADRWERKRQIVVLCLCIAAVGMLFAYARAPWLIVAAGMTITVCSALFSVAQHAYQAELFPTAIRARAVGIVYSFSRFSSIFVGFAIAAVLARYGTPGVFLFIGSAMVAAAALIAAFGPTTNRTSLEELAAP